MANKTKEWIQEKDEEGTATFTIAWREDRTNLEIITFELSELEHNIVKKTGELYPCLKEDKLHLYKDGELLPDAARMVSYTVRAWARQYEYWADEWAWDTAKWCHAYIGITTKEERKELGVEVEIQESCKELTTEELAPIFLEMGINIQEDEDMMLKEELLELAKSGAPKPKKGTRLGDALIRFTTEGGE